MCVDHAPNERFAANRDHTSHSDTTVCKTGESWIPTAKLCEDDGIGDEAEVEKAVNESYVDVPENTEARVSKGI